MKSFFLCLVFLISAAFGSPFLFTPDLDKLLKVMEVEYDKTPQSIVNATQKAWLRPAGKERWHVEDSLTPIQRKAVLDYCSKMGFFEELQPLYCEYDYAVILGAAVSRMEKRIAYFAKMAEKGIRFKKVILLSGSRPLDPSVEVIPEGCKTESDAMGYLWKNNPWSQKFTWEHHNCPMNGTKRPTTYDTFKLWLTKNPAPGRCLMFSNQPYCLYQQLVVQKILPPVFICETVGQGSSLKSINAQELLDTVARCLYESNNTNPRE